MPASAPTLVTTLTKTAGVWPGQIEGNFSLLQTFVNAVVADIAALIDAPTLGYCMPSAYVDGAVPAASASIPKAGIILPKCDVLGAYVRLGTVPATTYDYSLAFALRDSAGTALTGAGTIERADGDGAIVLVPPLSPVEEVAAGTFVAPYATITGDVTGVEDLWVTYLVRMA